MSKNGIKCQYMFFYNDSARNMMNINVLMVTCHTFNHCRVEADETFCGGNMSVPWLLMPWLLACPGHQQPWQWKCRINESLFWQGLTSTSNAISIWAMINYANIFLCFIENLVCKSELVEVMWYIYIYVYIYVCMYIYIYIYICMLGHHCFLRWLVA